MPGVEVKRLVPAKLNTVVAQVKHAFEVLKGAYTISVGSSSRDIRGTTSFTV